MGHDSRSAKIADHEVTKIPLPPLPPPSLRDFPMVLNGPARLCTLTPTQFNYPYYIGATSCKSFNYSNSLTTSSGTPAFGRIRWTHTYENTTGYDWRGDPIKETYDRFDRKMILSLLTINTLFLVRCISQDPNKKIKIQGKRTRSKS